MFDKEKHRYIQQLSDVQVARFDCLKIAVNEKFIDVYNDYSLTQLVDREFLENYAGVINSIYLDYFDLFKSNVMRSEIDYSSLSLGGGSASSNQQPSFSFRAVSQN